MAEIDRILWSITALTDLESIINYTARDSKYYAKNFANKIIKAVDILKIFPKSGRVVPEFGSPKIREILYKNYRIMYSIRIPGL